MNTGQLDFQASLRMAALTGAQPNECWSNAWDAIILLPGYFVRGAYVEGWIVIETATQIHLIEHGWNERADGCVIDSTIAYLAGDPTSASYYAGYRLPWHNILGAPEEVCLPLVRFSGYRDQGLEHHGYCHAYQEARKDATTRAQMARRALVVYRMTLRPEVVVANISSCKKI